MSYTLKSAGEPMTTCSQLQSILNSVCCSLIQNDWKNILKQREKASSVECKGSKSNKLINGSSLGLKIIMTVKEL